MGKNNDKAKKDGSQKKPTKYQRGAKIIQRVKEAPNLLATLTAEEKEDMKHVEEKKAKNNERYRRGKEIIQDVKQDPTREDKLTAQEKEYMKHVQTRRDIAREVSRATSNLIKANPESDFAVEKKKANARNSRNYRDKQKQQDRKGFLAKDVDRKKRAKEKKENNVIDTNGDDGGNHSAPQPSTPVDSADTTPKDNEKEGAGERQTSDVTKVVTNNNGDDGGNHSAPQPSTLVDEPTNKRKKVQSMNRIKQRKRVESINSPKTTKSPECKRASPAASAAQLSDAPLVLASASASASAYTSVSALASTSTSSASAVSTSASLSTSSGPDCILTGVVPYYYLGQDDLRGDDGGNHSASAGIDPDCSVRDATGGEGDAKDQPPPSGEIMNVPDSNQTRKKIAKNLLFIGMSRLDINNISPSEILKRGNNSGKTRKVLYRDTARIVFSEKERPNTSCYSVMVEKKDDHPTKKKSTISLHPQMHGHVDINKNNFCRLLLDRFRTCFGQICFDYLWCPKTRQKKTWNINIITNIILMAEMGILTKPDLCDEEEEEGDKYNGTVMLPFSHHMMQLLSMKWKEVNNMFDITYLPSKDQPNTLPQYNILWKATSGIKNCQEWKKFYVGKKAPAPADENEYCGISQEDIKSASYLDNVNKDLLDSLIKSREDVKFVCLSLKNDKHSICPYDKLSNAGYYSYHDQGDLDLVLFSIKEDESEDNTKYFRGIENRGVGNCFFESILDSGLIQLHDLDYFKATNGMLPKGDHDNDYFLRMDFVEKARLYYFGRKCSDIRFRTAGVEIDENKKNPYFINMVDVVYQIIGGPEAEPTTDLFLENLMSNMEQDKGWVEEASIYLLSLLYGVTPVIYNTGYADPSHSIKHVGEIFVRGVNVYNDMNNTSLVYSYDESKMIYIMNHIGGYPLDNFNTPMEAWDEVNHFICLKPVPENCDLNFDGLTKEGRILQVPSWSYKYNDIVQEGRTSYSHYLFERLRQKYGRLDIPKPFVTFEPWVSHGALREFEEDAEIHT